MSVPAVSVVLPVYNAEAYVAESIASILGQTHRDLELIVVDDGSTDATPSVVRSFTDPRIRHVHQPNQGVVKALNAGLAHARGAMIARHDADDSAMPERLAEQLAFLHAHPDVGLVGTWARVIDTAGNEVGTLRHPTGHSAITYASIFDAALVHPSVMFRRDVLERTGPYQDDPDVFEDHAMWDRMLRTTHAANIPQYLMRYRMVPTSASRGADRERRLVEQRRRSLRARVPGIAPKLVELIARTGIRHSPITWPELRAVRRILDGIIAEIGGTAEDQVYMAKDARARTLDFHLVRRTGPFTRLCDRIGKRIALALP